jgi:arsenate reductase
MSKTTIFHNPRCSKSRKTLELLREQGIEPEQMLYLEQPLTPELVDGLIAKLGIEPHRLLRPKEAEYKEAGLSPKSSRQDIVAAIVRFPKLMERPVVVHDGRAALGRPPELVLNLFDA